MTIKMNVWQLKYRHFLFLGIFRKKSEVLCRSPRNPEKRGLPSIATINTKFWWTGMYEVPVMLSHLLLLSHQVMSLVQVSVTVPRPYLCQQQRKDYNLGPPVQSLSCIELCLHVNSDNDIPDWYYMVLEFVDYCFGQDHEIDLNIFSCMQYAYWHLFIQLKKYIYKAGCVTWLQTQHSQI